MSAQVKFYQNLPPLSLEDVTQFVNNPDVGFGVDFDENGELCRTLLFMNVKTLLRIKLSSSKEKSFLSVKKLRINQFV